ncbi:hypothetical protein ASwh1_374 [Aeromonas phage Aswh_1]|nr:hypothetical protein ASwh1_374 [Aeromonas phage Aswh_1]
MFFIKFKSESDMEAFARISLGYSSHNKNLVERYGMNPFAVNVDATGWWWDTVDGDFTIEVKEESKYFEKVVAHWE